MKNQAVMVTFQVHSILLTDPRQRKLTSYHANVLLTSRQVKWKQKPKTTFTEMDLVSSKEKEKGNK